MMEAYFCVWCPREAFHYTPGDCRLCDKPLQRMEDLQ